MSTPGNKGNDPVSSAPAATQLQPTCRAQPYGAALTWPDFPCRDGKGLDDAPCTGWLAGSAPRVDAGAAVEDTFAVTSLSINTGTRLAGV